MNGEEEVAAAASLNHDGLVEMLNGIVARIEHHDKILGTDGNEIKRLVSAGVQEALMVVVSSPGFWNAMKSAMVAQTRDAAGGFVLSGLRRGIGAIIWGFLLAASIYMVGGWKLLLAIIATVRGNTP